ncbi:DUF982 domain-containing protein [Mycoplana rhizolycopersici]|uniref:DUF982 domain-containing protein n=1 Tax=Mycoplana rhizolycopersici TaxID=2746702 RepID=A0ABX2QJM5_9HYPH|nr:DUF982 domain-containing protein [Rhizobium rhizolycopersici]NVP57900.1 DUF982 domain-containing protein [Rhizobium rhizolycopersici]
MTIYEEWPRGVPIDLGDDGFVVVHNTFEASIILSNCWPERAGSAYSRAMEVLYDAFDDVVDDDTARLAFIAAAEEARLVVQLH